MKKESKKNEGLGFFTQEHQDELKEADRERNEEQEFKTGGYMPPQRKIVEMALQDIPKTTMIVRRWISLRRWR